MSVITSDYELGHAESATAITFDTNLKSWVESCVSVRLSKAPFCQGRRCTAHFLFQGDSEEITVAKFFNGSDVGKCLGKKELLLQCEVIRLSQVYARSMTEVLSEGERAESEMAVMTFIQPYILQLDERDGLFCLVEVFSFPYQKKS